MSSVSPVTNRLALPTPSEELVVIEPTGGWASIQFHVLWAHRELLYFLIWRDIKVRYRQAVMGAAWAILQPLLIMGVFTLFFGLLAGIQSDGLPYAAFALAGLVPWICFANGLNAAAFSVAGNAYLINKVHFPRLLIPIASILSGLLDFIVTVVLLLALSIYWRGLPTLSWLAIPFLMAQTVLVMLGIGLWFSALQVRFKDVQFLMGFVTQFWMFSTPVAYPSSLLPAKYQTLYALNPMVGVVDGFRWALLGGQAMPAKSLVLSVVVSLFLLVTGAFYFRRLEHRFADLV